VKSFFIFTILVFCYAANAQENPLDNPVQPLIQFQVNELIEKKAEYHRLTNGVQDGYRIKIHFGIDREAAEAIRTKCTTSFTSILTYLEYQQPNFVVLLGDYKTKLEAFDCLRKVQVEFPNAFIVKAKINVK